MFKVDGDLKINMKKIIVLSNNDNVMALYNWLKEKGYESILLHEPINIEIVKNFNPDLVISYNYRHIVKKDVIEYLGNKIINMHTSYLPWNKGASPNIWSFIEDTPKGVTIHRLEEGVDTGKIIIQKQIDFDEEKETLSTTYNKLNQEIVDLLKDNIEKILEGKYTLVNQKGKGSSHKIKDLDNLLNGRSINYELTIKKFKEFIGKK